MSTDILIVFAVLFAAVLLFTWDRVSYDMTAVIIMSALLISGIITPAEGLAGFSNPATVTIGAMFVLSSGLRYTGVLDHMGDIFRRLARHNHRMAVIVMMLFIGVLSAFINNTAAVAIFIPIILSIAPDLKTSPSKLLMPLSFTSMFGGVCTLIGTSTNILVSSTAEAHGLAPFTMFDFAPLGIIFFLVGFIYMMTIGIRLIPNRHTGEDLSVQYKINEYLTDIVLEVEFEHLGKTLSEIPILNELDVEVTEILDKNGNRTGNKYRRLETGDVLRIKGSAEEIHKLLKSGGILLKRSDQWGDVALHDRVLVEAVISSDSQIVGSMIQEVNFPMRFGAVVMAIRRHSMLRQNQLGNVRLTGGDTLLLSVDPERLPLIEQDAPFVIVTEIESHQQRREKMPIAISVLAGVVITAAFGLVPIVVSAVVGCVILVLTQCLKVEEIYQVINWKVIFLLAGVIPLGTAMEKTGAADMISFAVLDMLGAWGPQAVLSGFFLLAVMITNFISNQATVVLLIPIAIQAAGILEVDPRPLLIAITYAASLSFMTPIGYQTNTLIYGPGKYKFTDFTRVGTPLNLIFWLLATFLIPVFWPF